MAYVRTVRTSSGARAVQVVWIRHETREIEHIGWAHTDAEWELLKAVWSVPEKMEALFMPRVRGCV